MFNVSRGLRGLQWDYVLVRFAKKQKMSYDAGRPVRIDKREDEMQTTFMTRNDMHKSDAVTFSWPAIEDLAWHDEQDIVVTTDNVIIAR